MRSAEQLHQDGVAAINAGRLVRARRVLERARAAADDPDLLARVEGSLAYVLAETDDRSEALAMCDSALSRSGLSEQTRASVHGQRGLLHMLSGRGEDAIEDLTQSVSLDATPDVRGRGLLNRGNVYLQRNDARAAATDFTAAREPLIESGFLVEAAMADHNLGYSMFLIGDLVGALRAMDAARPVLAPLSPVNEATCDQDRAEVLLAAGLVEEGRTALRAASRAYGSRRLRRRQAEVDLVLGRSLLADDPRAAVVAARAAERRFDLAGATAMRTRASAVRFIAEIGTRRVNADLIDRGRAVAVELEREEITWLAALVKLELSRVGAYRDGQNDPPPRVSRKAPLAVRLLDREVRSEIAVARRRRRQAMEHLRLGLADLHAWQSSFGSLDLQTGVAGHGVRLAARGLALAVESEEREVLFEWSERARMLASRVQPVRAPEDDQIVADLTELREMAAEGGHRDPQREAELRQRVRERAWQYRGSGEVADPVSLAELTAALDEDTALVAYVATADCLVALVVTAERTTWVDLGDRGPINDLLGGLLPDLDVAAAEMPDAMGRFVRQELAARLDTIAERLVVPVLGALGERRVVLTPSGVLAGMPWTLLPGFVGRPVTVAQSATSWLARRTTALRAGSAGFVAGPRVARAEDEVTAAAKEWSNARVLTGESAGATAACELAETVDVLHVAAHGRHSAENPLFSGLQLADGPWFGYDIDRLRRAPDVVLLSACEVGRSNVRWGEELLGMTTAWLHAGARCVIASAAAVNDHAAYDVLVAVHQQLAAGVDPAAALAAAVPAVSADTAPVPLVCFG